MEFIEYYRIIRRRIWIAVVMAALTASVVVAARLMPKKVIYPAAGRVVVHENAKREVHIVGNELRMGVPQREEGFWSDIRQFVHSALILETAAADIGIVGDDEVERRLEHAEARQVEGSNVLEVTTGADGKEVAVKLCDAVMAQLGQLWQARQVVRVGVARQALTERLPTVHQEVRRLQREADKLAAPYQGSEPPAVLARLSGELTTIETQVVTTELSMGTAQAKVSILEDMAQGIGPRLARGRTPTAISPRVTRLREAILEKQIELDEARSRRTSEHQEVKAIEAQIVALQQRVKEVAESGEEEVGYEASILLQGTALQAEVDAAGLSRELELLRGRAAEIREQIPGVRTDARAFEEISSQLAGAQQTYATLRDHIDRLEAEEEQQQKATMTEVVERAVAQRMPRGLRRLALQLGMAILAGGGIGILVIFVLHYVDFSFQDEEEAEKMLGVRVLAGIPRSDVALPAAAPEISPEEAGPLEG